MMVAMDSEVDSEDEADSVETEEVTVADSEVVTEEIEVVTEVATEVGDEDEVDTTTITMTKIKNETIGLKPYEWNNICTQLSLCLYFYLSFSLINLTHLRIKLILLDLPYISYF